MADIGSIIDGKYEILKRIGQGGMSKVYLAMDLRLNKQWAVKEIRKHADKKNQEVMVQSLIVEANLMKKLDHPALPRIVDIIDNGNTIYVVMDYIEGESLDKILEEYGPQSQEVVIDWAKQLCDVLGYLHNQQPPVIYRDMKPANVMLKPEGNLKVIDFGIAREYKEENLADTVSLGTRGYAAPEQFGGKGQTDARTDIYCLGATLYHLVTGQNPSEPPYEMFPIRQWNPSLSGGLERILQKCTQLNPDDRYQNCDELMYALEHYEEVDDVYRRKQKRKLTGFIATCVMTVLLLAGGISCRIVASSINSNNYDDLVTVAESTDYEDKIRSYEEAIRIYPGNPKAYMCLLEAYEAENRFSKTENDFFLALYNANKSEFDVNDTETAELNYKIGMMYFNYYTEEDGSYLFSTRVQKAYSFFNENHQNAPQSFAYYEVSESYYQICTFYKKYILSSASIEEATKENYDALLNDMAQTMGQLQELNSYEQLSYYSGVIDLLYDQRLYMTNAAVEQEKIMTILDTAYKQACELTVQKEQSLKLQTMISEHYADYKEAILRCYTNEEGA